ncbi:DnaJ family domain-containing protein [Paenibacillus sp. 32352]|uniref:DnaJ family domain-containing protein n=1 Tax=Paenibacillus sp. 32352 TaxID=1969111 RepID=UPI0009AD7C4E|nr:DnaJ family domain-containing protein [Paenibacillus sp. 32352]
MKYLHSIAEEKIQKAIRQGEFDRLPGDGKPLPPDELENVPEELRVGFKILKNAGLIPEEMLLRKEMVTLGDLIAACQDDTERERLQNELTVKKLRYQSLMSDRGWLASDAFSEYEHQINQKLTDNEK